jgi:hypothetical protein
MSAFSTVKTRLQEQWIGMTSRERVLLVIMFGVMGTGVSLITLYLLMQNLWRLEDENQQRRQVISELLERRADFAAESAERERIEDRLNGNEVRLSSFIESRVNEAGISRPSEYTDRQTQRDNGITVMETTAEFDRMSLGDIDELMNSIESSDDLVFIQGLTVAPARRSTEGELTVELNLVTFKRSRGNRD